MSERHRLLERQLRKTLGEKPPAAEDLRKLLDLVDASYRQADDERRLLEHSMDTVSEELGDRYRRLQSVLAESRQHEQALSGALSLLQSVVDSTEDGLLVVDLEGRIELANRRFAELWNIPEEVLSQADDSVALSYVLDQLAEPEAFLAKVQSLYDEPEAESFDIVRFLDGRLLERFSMPHRMEGRIVGRLWSFRDVSKRARLEEQLRQAQKMEAVGHLAGGVAHDFNNLLTVIFGHAELLERKLKGFPALLTDLRRILDASDRAARLTRQLLTFSRRQVLQPEVVDLNEVLRDFESMLGRLLRENVEIRLQLQPELGGVRVDQGQLEQALLNLALNARDAMPAGGTLSFSTSTLDAEMDATWAVPGGARGTWIVVEVRDTGSGMSAETQERIFEPFFTTKPKGEGTGLGLAMVYGFVQQSDGRITVTSQPGRGTRFRMYFPRVPLSGSGKADEAHDTASGNEVVLLVEDEPDLRSMVQRALEQRGYRVLTATDAESAARAAETGDTAIDLLLTDIFMPGGSGAELSRRVRQRHPGARVLFTSGYTDAEIQRAGVRSASVRFLAKPFTLEQLASAVRATLDLAPEAAPAASEDD